MTGSMRRRALAWALASAAVLALWGCSTPAATGTNTIVEKNTAFSPTSLTVQVGDVVTFDNQDSVPHHVFVGATDLGVQAPGVRLAWTATANGTFAFKCVIHPSMTGQIIVGSGGGATAPAGGGSGAPVVPPGY